ncbi:SMC-Scp complex subunit ScpB [Rhodospirillum rubrum]|uniref:SMC-Scp complex subunit ScpB n=1 Tax=Rhodospirillum rubrum TaxID=1085 RepID=UPI001908304C|nr:SMC-Scp complex subunit ScpB [Rhodospirillum rubrum]MBK1663574.1 SMC-Scp complex subunit ScpB [Rhodospirillum rubrum]MBK1675625.1 SMC-Scp complex subunit ScpB [Rhodospirillum rubrum]
MSPDIDTTLPFAEDGADVALIRLIEALLFAAPTPLSAADLASRLPAGADVAALLGALADHYHQRGVVLVESGGRWAFRTAADLAGHLRLETTEPRRLSRAAIETLAIIAYHQPVTRADIEEIRGVALSKGTLDLLLEAGWIHPCGRRQTAGRPLTWGTTESFLDHFGLGSVDDLPGVEDLKAAGLLDRRPALAAYGTHARDGDDILADVEDEGTLTGQPGRRETDQLDLLRPPPRRPRG